MKDFKKMPKMACGGGVGKYQNGGDVEPTFLRTGKPNVKPNLQYEGHPEMPVKATPIDMPSRLGSSKRSETSSVDMPSRLGAPRQTINIPGTGEINRSEMQARKRGGTVKKKK